MKITVEGLPIISKMPEEIQRGLEIGLKKAVLIIEGDAKRSFRGRSHSELSVGTGHLRRSIYSRMKSPLEYIVGSNVKYANIHQYGGTIKPKTKEVLQFKIGDKFITTKKVNMPARPFIKPNDKKIKQAILESILGEVS